MYTLIIRRGIVLSLRRRRIWKCNGYITFEKDKCGELLRMVIPNFLPNLKFVEMYFDNVKCARYTAQLKTGGKKWFKYLLKLRPLGVVNVMIVYSQRSSVTSAWQPTKKLKVSFCLLTYRIRLECQSRIIQKLKPNGPGVHKIFRNTRNRGNYEHLHQQKVENNRYFYNVI